MLRIAIFFSLLALCSAPAVAQLVTPESNGMTVPGNEDRMVTPATPGGQAPEGEGSPDEPYVVPPKNVPEGPEMTAWAGRAVCNALKLNHASYSTELKKSSKNFSHPGWKQFTSDLLASKMIEGMSAQQQNMSPEPCAEPALTRITEEGGQKKWHYTMPLMLQLVGADIGLTTEMEATFTIERALSHPDGLNITGWDWQEKK